MGVVRGQRIFGNALFMRGDNLTSPVRNCVGIAVMFKNKRASIPSGYSNVAACLVPPTKNGEIVCRIISGGTLTSSISAIANCTANLEGSGALAASGAKGVNLQCNMEGGGVLEAAVRAIANLQCDIQIGAQPSAFDIAQAVLNAVATQYNIPGTIGNKINSTSAAGDPLNNDLDGYGPGTAGEKLKKLPLLGAIIATVGD